MRTIMGLIAEGGGARSDAMEALYAAKEGDFEKAAQKLKEADEALNRAHDSQTRLLTQEASGERMEVTLLLVHAQDHLMNALTVRDLAKEMVDLYRGIHR